MTPSESREKLAGGLVQMVDWGSHLKGEGGKHERGMISKEPLTRTEGTSQGKPTDAKLTLTWRGGGEAGSSG